MKLGKDVNEQGSLTTYRDDFTDSELKGQDVGPVVSDGKALDPELVVVPGRSQKLNPMLKDIRKAAPMSSYDNYKHAGKYGQPLFGVQIGVRDFKQSLPVPSFSARRIHTHLYLKNNRTQVRACWALWSLVT